MKLTKLAIKIYKEIYNKGNHGESVDITYMIEKLKTNEHFFNNALSELQDKKLIVHSAICIIGTPASTQFKPSLTNYGFENFNKIIRSNRWWFKIFFGSMLKIASWIFGIIAALIGSILISIFT